jgi:diacylglycerol kinase (ATP)
MNILVVANESSGSSDPAGLDGACSILEKLGSVTRLSPASRESFDAEVLAAAEGADLVVVAGGDGTLNCAVNALEARLDDLELALLPMGTGNDLARTLEIPMDAREAAEIVRDGGTRSIDVGVAEGAGVRRLFVNACMGGFPIEVNEAIDEDLKKKLGPFAFWWGAVKTVADLPKTRVELDGQTIEDCVAVGVGNGRTCGGGMEVWPEADPTDGLLEAAALAASNITEALKLGAEVKAGKHLDNSGVATARQSSVTIDSHPAIEINVDGELVDLTTPARFTLERKLTLRVPLR